MGLNDFLPLAGDLAAGAIGYFGQASANDTNMKIAQQQMRFQEHMSNTAWQRGVKDMEAAGINPMLSVERGGASSPAGASAHMENPLGMASQAASSASGHVAQMQMTRAAVDQARANVDLTKQQTAKMKAESKWWESNAEEDAQTKIQQRWRADADRILAGTNANVAVSTKEDLIKSLITQYSQSTTTAEIAALQRRMLQLGLPKSEVFNKIWDVPNKFADWISSALRGADWRKVKGALSGGD